MRPRLIDPYVIRALRVADGMIGHHFPNEQRTMRFIRGIKLLSFSVLASTVSSQLLLPALFKGRTPARISQDQEPIMNVPNVVLPPSDNHGDSGQDPENPVIISDVIGKERSINIFSGLTRDIESISKRLDNGSQNTTVLAPLNSALMDLPRKPWEDPDDYKVLGENAYEGQKGEDRAHQNLRRFVEAHVLPVSPWKEHEKVETLAGGKIWFENKGGKKTIQPGDIEVSSISNSVANGEVWMLKGVLNYSR
ncbi:MAG: hypothetical protein M1837_001097 [Sclerophora amabilis]|nr:MAG: hypothetical protein M1837_001097 [Sclerophora amabilis]